MNKNNKDNKIQQPKSVVDKIRQFRDDFVRSFNKRNKKFDIHQFTNEFLKRPKAKNT